MKAIPKSRILTASRTSKGYATVDAYVENVVRTLQNNYGLKVKLALQPSDVHDPTEIPNYLAGYKPFMYRADQASPVVLVDHDQDKYRQFAQDDTFRRVDVKGSNTPYGIPEVDPSTSLTNYSVVNRYIGAFVPDQTESNATNPNYRPRFAASRRCRRAIDLDRELDVFSTSGLLGTTGNWASSSQVALAAGQNWNGGASANPILDLQTCHEVTAQPIAAFWMNRQTANAFVRNALVKDHFRQFLGDNAITGALNDLGDLNKLVDFAIPGVGFVRVSDSKVKNESTGNLDYILPKGVVFAVTVPASQFPLDGEEIATTYTFRRKGPSGTGYEAREFRVEDRGPLGGTFVVISMADIAVMTANNAGAIITGAVT